MSKEKPILFNAEMVKAILEGRKTVTRRIIKNVNDMNFIGFISCSIPKGDEGKAAFGEGSFEDIVNANIQRYVKPPYEVGDTLWVRETWTTIDNFKNYADVEMDKNIKYLYKCDDNGKEHVFIDVGVNKWKPSIHMPKEASRIFLRVTNVRVERLQSMKFSDLKNEGITEEFPPHAADEFHKLWDSTLKKDQLDQYGFNVNPYAWVIEFEKLEGYNE